MAQNLSSKSFRINQGVEEISKNQNRDSQQSGVYHKIFSQKATKPMAKPKATIRKNRFIKSVMTGVFQDRQGASSE
jgi:hypothetical protein